jgi:RNA polymerase sigma factor (TIGR02999 family)
MSTRPQSEVTRVLQDLGEGDPHAAQKLLPLVYEELRVLAQQRMKNEPAGLTLQPTALVHEAYLRLIGGDESPAATWANRGHFFAAAAEAMRRILIERARRSRQRKRGGDRKRVALDDVEPAAADESRDDILALDQTLRRLEAQDRVRSDVVKLRYFAGLTIEQTADLLGISDATVVRHWTYARMWLYQEIKRQGEG